MSKRALYITIIGVIILVAAIIVVGILSSPQKKVVKTQRVTLKVAAPPDPNFIPFFVMLNQKTLENQGIDLEFVAAKGLPDMMSIIKKGQADIAIFSIPHGAKAYAQGASLQLVGVHVWKAIYVVAPQNISGWKDLVGKKVLIAFKGAPPDVIARNSMKAAGYNNPDKDFKIDYPPVPDIPKLIFSGKADAAVVPEPWVSKLILQSGGKLKVAIDPQKGFTQLVPGCKGGEIPMGGLWVMSSNVANKKEAVKKFTIAFDKACDYARNHPQETGKITSEYFLKYFHKQLSPQVIAYSLSNGLLKLDFRGTEDVKPILPTCLKAFKFPAPSEGIYYQGL